MLDLNRDCVSQIKTATPVCPKRKIGLGLGGSLGKTGERWGAGEMMSWLTREANK